MKCRFFFALSCRVVACLLLVVMLCPLAAGVDASWTPVGLCGGGAMFAPAISPVDPSFMILCCDMSGVYVSRDGGRTWRLVDYRMLQINTRCVPAMHPRNAGTVLASDGYAGRVLKLSTDYGVHWRRWSELDAPACGRLAFHPRRPRVVLAGTTDGVRLSVDGGLHWKRCRGPRGACIGFAFLVGRVGGREVVLAATERGLWRADGGCAHWKDLTSRLPGKKVLSIAGGTASDGGSLVYCAVPVRKMGGSLAGGVYVSTDGGMTWRSAMGEGINKDVRPADKWAMGGMPCYLYVLCALSSPRRVYTLNTGTGVWPPHHATVYRSDDAGKRWCATCFPDPRFKRFNVEYDWHSAYLGQYYQEKPLGAAICPSNPDVLIVTGSMRCLVTVVGGHSWRCAHARPAAPLKVPRKPGESPLRGWRRSTDKNSRWSCNGLVVTTTWEYHVDPFDPSRHYICYTDIGFARSTDGGRSWMWWGTGRRPPWLNTCYHLAFDPSVPGVVWGAFSEVHDIPNGNIVFNRHWGGHPERGGGGVCVSKDHGNSWKVLSGLPDAPVCSIVVDPSSPAGRRRLFAAVFGRGVYVSEDGGETWRDFSNGLGFSGVNMRVYRLYLHRDGTLFALVSARRGRRGFDRRGVGLYVCGREKDKWRCISKGLRLSWPKDFFRFPVGQPCDLSGGRRRGRYLRRVVSYS